MLPIEKISTFWFTRLWQLKRYIFYEFSKILEFYLSLDKWVLTKIFQIQPKLTFDVFHILNHDHISKIEKTAWCYRPPPKKAFFWGGGLYHQIYFSILEIWPWFKIWKTSKVSFGSIWNILVNTWSTLGQHPSS